MTGEIKKLIFQEITNNDTVMLHDLYKIVLEKIKDPITTDTQKRHRVRSILNELCRNDKLARIAPLTYKKLD